MAVQKVQVVAGWQGRAHQFISQAMDMSRGWALGAEKTEPQQRPSTEAARGAPVSLARVLRPRGDVAPRLHRG